MRILALLPCLAFVVALSGCAVVDTAASVTGTVISTTVDVAGDVVSGTADAVTGGGHKDDDDK